MWEEGKQGSRSLLAFPVDAAKAAASRANPLLEFLRQRVLEDLTAGPDALAVSRAIDLIVGYFLQRVQVMDALSVHEEHRQALKPGVLPGDRSADSPKIEERAALLANFVELLPAHVRTVYKESGVGVAAELLGVRPFRLDLRGLAKQQFAPQRELQMHPAAGMAPVQGGPGMAAATAAAVAEAHAAELKGVRGERKEGQGGCTSNRGGGGSTRNKGGGWGWGKGAVGRQTGGGGTTHRRR